MPGVTDSPEGALGTDRGVTDVDASEYELLPTEFTAATRKMYWVPFVNDVTEAVVAEETPSANVDHDVPEFVENCTT